MIAAEKTYAAFGAMRAVQVVGSAPASPRESVLSFVPSRREPDPVAAADLSNVIPFARRRPAVPAPTLAISLRERLIPLAAGRDRRALWAAIFAGSLLVHAGVFAFFFQEKPKASIGVQAIAVELVLGDNNAAGVAEKPSPSQDPDNSQHQEEKNTQDSPVEKTEQAPEPVRAVTPPPPEAQVKEAEVKPVEPAAEVQPVEDVKPADETPVPLMQEALPVEKAPEPVKAEEPQQPQPVVQEPKPQEPKPQEPVQQKPEEPKKAQPEKTEPQKTPQKKTAQHKPSPKPDKRKDDDVSRAQQAMQASRGAGAGRSDADANYAGMVRAHLARYQRPQTGDRGRVIVSFALDGHGSVTSVRLSNGAASPALNQEALAMVRRASPFPAPPSGRTQQFTVPINFETH